MESVKPLHVITTVSTVSEVSCLEKDWLMENGKNNTVSNLCSFGSGPGSSVGIATGYRLDGLGIESRWRRDYPYLSRPALAPTQPPVQRILGLSRR
jgi:hypothetical protein